MDKNWENMSIEEKNKFCRESGCPFYYRAIDECMVDEVIEHTNFNAKQKTCYNLKGVNKQ